MPTWVPNWAFSTQWDPEPLIDWTLQKRPYRACGDSIPYLHSDEASSVLTSDGLLFDEIKKLDRAWHPKEEEPPISGKYVDVLRHWEDLAHAGVDHCPYGSSEGRKNAFWRTVIADPAGDAAAPKEDWAYVELWFDRVGWSADLPDFSSKNAWVHAKLEENYNNMSKKLVKRFREIHPWKWTSFLEVLAAGAPIERKYRGYLRRIYRLCAHRALFVTQRGYMGLAPWNAKEGDSVVVLDGGQTPFLLRTSPRTGKTTLVGEAYVYGIMDGEAMHSDIAEKRGTQVFHIS